MVDIKELHSSDKLIDWILSNNCYSERYIYEGIISSIISVHIDCSIDSSIKDELRDCINEFRIISEFMYRFKDDAIKLYSKFVDKFLDYLVSMLSRESYDDLGKRFRQNDLSLRDEYSIINSIINYSFKGSLEFYCIEFGIDHHWY